MLIKLHSQAIRGSFQNRCLLQSNVSATTVFRDLLFYSLHKSSATAPPPPVSHLGFRRQ